MPADDLPRTITESDFFGTRHRRYPQKAHFRGCQGEKMPQFDHKLWPKLPPSENDSGRAAGSCAQLADS
jgi:hypothetical protein